MLRPVRLLRSPIDELVITGSRWSRLIAKAVQRNDCAQDSPSASSAAAAISVDGGDAQLPTPFITVIPVLHVASLQFYDKVLDYMKQAVQERGNVVILLEGICDNKESEVQQMEEYFQIARDEKLRDAMLCKADDNTLYKDDTMRTICEELAVKYEILARQQATMRLQECYLKPKMAALVGEHLRNDADLNLKEVEAILLEENSSGDESLIPISSLGAHPAVRRLREQKVARAARLRCAQWLHRGCEGEVILPWGFYHTEGIKHNILAMNAQDDSVVFVESDEMLCRVAFGVEKDLLA